MYDCSRVAGSVELQIWWPHTLTGKAVELLEAGVACLAGRQLSAGSFTGGPTSHSGHERGEPLCCQAAASQTTEVEGGRRLGGVTSTTAPLRFAAIREQRSHSHSLLWQSPSMAAGGYLDHCSVQLCDGARELVPGPRSCPCGTTCLHQGDCPRRGQLQRLVVRVVCPTRCQGRVVIPSLCHCMRTVTMAAMYFVCL